MSFYLESKNKKSEVKNYLFKFNFFFLRSYN